MTGADGDGGVLRIRIKKGRDGPDTLACHRPDGSVAVQKVHPAFPVHDLTHYAVEHVLGFRHAFYGTMADGWDFDDFGQPWPRGRLSAEAVYAEHLVGVIWREVVPGSPRGTAAEINRELAGLPRGHDEPLGRRITDQELAEIRRTQRRLMAEWSALGQGETMELRFPLGARP